MTGIHVLNKEFVTSECPQSNMADLFREATVVALPCHQNPHGHAILGHE